MFDIVGVVPGVGVGATTVPVKPGVAIVSPVCTCCKVGVTVVPVGAVGAVSNVSITDITLRLLSCSVIVG
jgi:hypothetical protein